MVPLGWATGSVYPSDPGQAHPQPCMPAELEAAPSFAQAPSSPELPRSPLEWDAMFDGKLGMSSVIIYMVIM